MFVINTHGSLRSPKCPIYDRTHPLRAKRAYMNLILFNNPVENHHVLFSVNPEVFSQQSNINYC